MPTWAAETEQWIRRGILELELYANKKIHDDIADTHSIYPSEFRFCFTCGSIGGHVSSCEFGLDAR